ncbi:MAG TPA: permease-like cell division protein FtsX [Actinomycetota bacterium]
MPIRIDYALAETSQNLRRNSFMSLASVMVVAVSLYLVGGVLLGRFAIDRFLDLQTEQLEVQVFLANDVSDDERDSLRGDLQQMPEVATVVYESKQEAFQRFKQLFRDQPGIVENTEADALPESFRVKLRDPEKFEIVSDRLEGRPGIEEIRDYRTLLRQFFGVINDIGRIGLVLVLLLSAAAAMIIGTTIRLAIFARRKEIGIMKLVGASNWFIRIPFMLEGLVHGVVGTAVAVGLLIATRPLFVRAAENIQFLNVTVSVTEILTYGAWLLVGGVLLGIFGSLVGLRRFLEV